MIAFRTLISIAASWLAYSDCLTLTSKQLEWARRLEDMVYPVVALKDDCQHSLEKLPSNSVMNSFSELAKPRIRDFSFLKNLPPKDKIIVWFCRSVFGEPKIWNCHRCGSVAFSDFRGGFSSPPQAAKFVRTIFNIEHQKGNVRFEPHFVKENFYNF